MYYQWLIRPKQAHPEISGTSHGTVLTGQGECSRLHASPLWGSQAPGAPRMHMAPILRGIFIPASPLEKSMEGPGGEHRSWWLHTSFRPPPLAGAGPQPHLASRDNGEGSVAVRPGEGSRVLLSTRDNGLGRKSAFLKATIAQCPTSVRLLSPCLSHESAAPVSGPSPDPACPVPADHLCFLLLGWLLLPVTVGAVASALPPLLHSPSLLCLAWLPLGWSRVFQYFLLSLP